MSLTANLTMRLGAIVLVGFILLQLAVVILLGLPDGEAERPYSLPSAEQFAAIVDAVENRSPEDRPAIVRAFDGGLFSVRLADAPPPPRRGPVGARLETLADRYRMMLNGRPIRIDSRSGLLSGWLDGRSGPVRFLARVRVAVPLDRGGWLLVEGRPSAVIQTYLRRRSIVALLVAVALIVILFVAIRQTTRPLTRVAAGVRGFSAGNETPDLPLEGPRDVRDLAQAFNEMKARIAGLMTDRTRILAAVAHDLRTYMTRLRLRADYIEDERQRVRAIADLDEMALLVDDTLLFASLDGQPDLLREAIDLPSAIVGLVARRRETGCAVTLAIKVDGAMPVLAPPLALDRIFDNLVDNALRHGRHVDVRIDRIGPHARLTVSDDGPGVPADQIAGLAEPFHRLDPSRDRHSGGAGLGLAIVRAFAQQMGGTLRFAASSSGGLQAEVLLPVASD